MTDLTKGERKQIRAMIGGLKGLDLEDESRRTLRQKADVIFGMFDKLEVPKCSDYYKEIHRFLQQSDKYFNENLRFDEPSREYVGKIRFQVYFVNAAYDHIFVERMYDRLTRVKWGFNMYGRLYFLSVIKHPQVREYRERTIVKEYLRVNGSNDKLEWDNSFAKGKHLPEDITGVINPGLLKQSAAQRFQSILRFGHGTSLEILLAQRNNEIGDPKVFRTGQKKLRCINNDGPAWYMLERAAAIIPAVTDNGGDSRTIDLDMEYSLNEPALDKLKEQGL